MSCERGQARARPQRWAERLLALACALGTGSCEDERTEYICRAATDCGGLRHRSDCKARLDDALTDGRTTAERASACAVCVHQSSNDCADLLVTRDCDVACEGVDLITDMHTSADDRRVACGARQGLCDVRMGDGSDSCLDAVETQLRANPKLDRELSGCVGCLASAIRAAELASAVQGTRTCARDTCDVACSSFKAITEPLRSAGVIRSVCDSAAVTCKSTSGFLGEASDCVDLVVGQADSALALEACAACLANATSCEAAYGGSSAPDAGDSSCRGTCAPLLGLE